jgi:hypothetical protein
MELDESEATLRVAVELGSLEPERPILERALRGEQGPPARCFRLSAGVSARGLRFVARLPFEVGERLKVRFQLPFDPPVTVSGTAVVQRKAGRPSEISLDVESGDEALKRYLVEEGI